MIGWWCKWTFRIAAHVTFVTAAIIVLVEVNKAAIKSDTSVPIAVICVLLLLSAVVIYVDLLRKTMKPEADIMPGPRTLESGLIREINVPSTSGDYINTTVFEPIMNFRYSLLNLGNVIGEGAFGKVLMAEAKDLLIPGVITHVAVKMLKSNHSEDDAKALKYEMEVMKSVGRHENIVNLLGCSSDSYGKLLVIMDYALHGSLQSFLRKHNPADSSAETTLGQSDLVNIVCQVASGMAYLASKKVIVESRLFHKF
jgi:Protein tyrosine and serine/threonine kinase